MSINLDSHSELGRFKRQNGLGKSSANIEQPNKYILECRYVRELNQRKDECMKICEALAPTKFKKMERAGFQDGIRDLGDTAFARFCRLAEKEGIMTAYRDMITPVIRQKRQDDR